MKKNPKLIPLFLLMLFVQHAKAQFTKLLDFDGLNGANPRSSFISDGTYLYATTSEGSSTYGVVFKIKKDGTAYQTLLGFTRADGKFPDASLISDGTNLYGTAIHGGLALPLDAGVVFKLKTDGSDHQTLLYFDGTNGGVPEGSLLLKDTSLYGMSVSGGSSGGNGYGVIYKTSINGSGFQKLLDFNRTIGGQPHGALTNEGDFLYGMTTIGGGFTPFGDGFGTIFKIKTDGTGYQKMLDFDGTNGSNPWGSLFSDGTYLYGMTQNGGTNQAGVIFKIKLDGTGYQKLLDFNTTNGGNPLGSLISDGIYLYGMTSVGGAFGKGLVFSIKPDGTGYQDLFDFDGINGSTPYGSLFNDGTYLYGLTAYGGTNGNGVMFKLNPTGVLPITLMSFNGQLKHNSVLLNWQTVNELNAQKFTIERSTGTAFTPLGSVPALNKPGVNNYTFTDAQTKPGVNYYRLAMLDKNGAITYSSTFKVNNGDITFSLKLTPNPAADVTVLNIVTPLQGPYSITIADAMGHLLNSSNGSCVIGKNTLQLNIGDLKQGVYIVTYRDANGVHSVKMVKK